MLVAAVVLGIIQGLTEFLPISSSAHLILVPWVFGWEPQGLVFDVSLHVGTAIAVLAYFWRDWMLLARAVFAGLLEKCPFGTPERRLAWYLVVGTLPATCVGLAFEETVEAHLRSPLIPALTLVVFGVLLRWAEKRGRQERSLNVFNLSDSIWIGASQALALVPGVSRSGITITTALLRDADKPSAARFSFLLSTPVIVGAGLLEGVRFLEAVRHSEVGSTAAFQWPVLAAGVAVAALTGFLCIRYFLRYIQTRSLLPFVLYRFALATVVLAYHFALS